MPDKKLIWIVNYYTGTPERASNPRYVEFARRFMDAGYDVITFNSSRSAKTDEEQKASGQKFLDKHYGDFHFIHVSVPSFEGNGVKRMLSIFSFAWNIFKARKQFQRPDIVLHNLHTPFDYPVMWTARKLKAKYVAEAWDLWPEDFVTFGLIGAKNPVMKFFYYLEKKLYIKADQIIFTQEGATDYLRGHGWTSDCGGKINLDKVHYVNNGVNLAKFDSDCKQYPRPDADLNAPDTYKIIYLGSIRLVNHVKDLIDAAAILKDNPKYRFFIYGDGTDREKLIKYATENGIDNVVFKEKHIPLCEVAYVVSQATVNIMNYQKDFGIHGVSSGKMFQYMAAGRPICCNIELNYSEISRNNLGIDEFLETPEQYADAIKRLAEQPADEYQAMCGRVRECAHKFDFDTLAAREIAILES